ncbi:MAG TPA: PHP domain-containing protein [Candidatus Absconditabacterales bacterium]|nr:PHP domain-containing protein [Candidatus Absconditabacterales bacterium]
MKYTHLHGHSTFSFLEAIGTPSQIIKKAGEIGYKNIALTDFGGMYGVVAFYEAAKELDINPIIGTELGFVIDINGYNKIENVGNIVLLAKSIDGYKSLMKIVSHANQEGINGKPKLDINMLEKYNKDLIAIVGSKKSWLGKMVLNADKDEKILEILSMIQEKIGKENVYLEMIAQDESEDSELKKVNKKILELSEKENIDCVVNNVYYYLNKDDKETWEMALAIKDGNKMYDNNRRKPKGQYYIMNEDEIKNIMLKNNYEERLVKGRMKNNEKIASKIKIEIPMGQALFPNYTTPEEIQKIYEDNKNNLISE